MVNSLLGDIQIPVSAIFDHGKNVVSTILDYAQLPVAAGLKVTALWSTEKNMEMSVTI